MQAARREATAPKRATNVSLSDPLIAEAKSLGINLSQAAESGIAQAIKDKKTEQWLIENRESLEGWNVYVEKHGLPLARYRQF
ncbi:MAG TPA: type II toxin-antitoxin system CcdA family antitoxin [Alphaproteobacteria bacterium]|jgi:antitoxin CcdA|nr:type II toxin-antitoxin system CcdA family antitoxin [Alphaproteobacteria bacterium]